MQVRARKAFSSRYGMKRVGNVFSAEPAYAKELEQNGNVEILPDKLGPDRIQAKTTAPHIKAGKDEPTEPPPSQLDPNMADSKADGPAKPLSASRRGRVSRRTT